MFDQFKGSWEELKSSIHEGWQHAQEAFLKTLFESREKIQEGLDKILIEINNLEPILLECGYLIGDLSVIGPLRPEFRFSILKLGEGTKKPSEILNERSDSLSLFQKGVLQALIQANQFDEITQQHGFGFQRLGIAFHPPTFKVIINFQSPKIIRQIGIGFEGQNV